MNIIGIGLRTDLFITPKGFTVSGTADVSGVKTSNVRGCIDCRYELLSNIEILCRRCGDFVWSYSESFDLGKYCHLIQIGFSQTNVIDVSKISCDGNLLYAC